MNNSSVFCLLLRASIRQMSCSPAAAANLSPPPSFSSSSSSSVRPCSGCFWAWGRAWSVRGRGGGWRQQPGADGWGASRDFRGQKGGAAEEPQGLLDGSRCWPARSPRVRHQRLHLLSFQSESQSAGPSLTFPPLPPSPPPPRQRGGQRQTLQLLRLWKTLQ